jgi:uncharacterized membrane protein
LAGFSVFLSAQRRIQKTGKGGYLRYLTLRVFYLFILASLLNIFRNASMTTINILHVIGISILICGLVKISESAAVCVGLLACALVYSFVGPFEPPPVTSSFLFHHVLILLKNGEYPPGMWFVYSLVGLCACWFYRDKLQTKVSLLISSLTALTAAVLILMGVKLVMWENTAPFLALMLASIFGMYYMVFTMYTKKDLVFLHPVAAYGRHALPIYMVHQFLFITIPTLFGFKNKLNEAGVLAVLFGFMAATSFLIQRYETKRPAYGKRLCP